MNTSATSIRSCIEQKVALFTLESECCCSCSDAEFEKYHFYKLIDRALGYERVTSILTYDEIIELGSFADCINSTVVLDGAGAIITGGVASLTSPIAVAMGEPEEIDSDLDAASQCIRAQLADYVREGTCCCDCEADATFEQYHFYALIDKVLHYDRVREVLTEDEIQELIAFTGCSATLPVFRESHGGIVTGGQRMATSVVWGQIGGHLADQPDLQAALDAKQKLITISDTPPLAPQVNDLWIDIS